MKKKTKNNEDESTFELMLKLIDILWPKSRDIIKLVIRILWSIPIFRGMVFKLKNYLEKKNYVELQAKGYFDNKGTSLQGVNIRQSAIHTTPSVQYSLLQVKTVNGSEQTLTKEQIKIMLREHKLTPLDYILDNGQWKRLATTQIWRDLNFGG